MNELNFARFDAKLEQRFAEFEAKMERRFSEQSRWMFLCWATLLASNMALWMR